MNAPRILALITLMGAGFVVNGCSSTSTDGDADEGSSELMAEESTTSLNYLSTSTLNYYVVQNDNRHCIAPLCGGYWVTRANRPTTRCADGSVREACYVGSLDLTGAQLTSAQASQVYGAIGSSMETTRVVIRGSMAYKNFGQFGNLGTFKATEAWRAPGPGTITGVFYRVSDSGVRCNSTPCASFLEAKLNSTARQNIEEVDFTSAPGSWNQKQEAEDDAAATGLIIAGDDYVDLLEASQYFVRIASGETAGGNCDVDSDCVPGLLCCYPCAGAGCHDACMTPENGQCPR